VHSFKFINKTTAAGSEGSEDRSFFRTIENGGSKEASFSSASMAFQINGLSASELTVCASGIHYNMFAGF
jgi:hypothetical protein